MKLFVVNSEAESLGIICSSLEGVFTSEEKAQDFIDAQDCEGLTYFLYECYSDNEGRRTLLIG